MGTTTEAPGRGRQLLRRLRLSELRARRAVRFLSRPPEGWTAPTEVERALYEAKLRGDRAVYVRALAQADLYHPNDRAEADAGRYYIRPVENPVGRGRAVPVRTEGRLSAPGNRSVYFAEGLGGWADLLDGYRATCLVVNPGSPCEAFLPARAFDRRFWRALAGEVDVDARRGRLRWATAGGEQHGRTAHGLACGALLSVVNGEVWNSLAWHGDGYDAEKRRLADWWDVTDRESWRTTTAHLLEPGSGSRAWTFVLDVRRSLAQERGGDVDTGVWRRGVENALRAGAAEEASSYVLTAEGVTAPEPVDTEVLDAEVAGARRLVERISRYEARFRADGLLPEGGWVRNVEAWNYGRAVHVARWGVGARYCGQDEAGHLVRRAGELCRVAYNSWEQLAAGHVLGRCLHFDEEEFGDWYHEMRKAHQVLTTHPQSPWRTLSFSRLGH
ncbi:DUF1266 domain-containing protein [Streptomyces xiaopingdaonensis]|uniref:DUF1266 domain-containing protein n=1 Tax=Streptomyces xiaopingdaonensis TaxID=1565415 RepID=UPI00037F004E|nr:DUF1266 domain-containing protein [Streptomyces xiaopingdaonensis]